VLAEQLPVALALAPDLVTFHAGPNDVLRPGVDLPALLGRYEAAVEQLVATGARVVLFTSLTRAGGSGRLADRLEARFLGFSAGIRVIAARLGCVLVDDEAVTALADRRFWAVDRLHLNALGHARVAANVLAHLGVADEAVLGGPPGWWAVPLPPPDPVTRREALATDAEWLRAHVVPWIGRRVRGVSSGDGRDPKDPVPRPVLP
jgi:hypothetical protein